MELSCELNGSNDGCTGWQRHPNTTDEEHETPFTFWWRLTVHPCGADFALTDRSCRLSSKISMGSNEQANFEKRKTSIRFITNQPSSCDYSEYVPKTEYDQQKSRTSNACQDTNKPGKCNFSKFIASTNAYIKRPMFRTNYITQTECARQRQTCEKERPRRIKDLEKIAPLVPLSLEPASASSADSREETSLLCIHLHVVPDRSNTAQKCVDGPPSLGLHLLRVARHMPSHV